jgi:D-ribose pyranose/furanose isomerase RbsD
LRNGPSIIGGLVTTDTDSLKKSASEYKVAVVSGETVASRVRRATEEAEVAAAEGVDNYTDLESVRKLKRKFKKWASQNGSTQISAFMASLEHLVTSHEDFKDLARTHRIRINDVSGTGTSNRYGNIFVRTGEGFSLHPYLQASYDAEFNI